jgi:hypothetical protein
MTDRFGHPGTDVGATREVRTRVVTRAVGPA